MNRKKKRFGIVGGLGPLAGADIFFKLVKATPAYSDQEHFKVIFEQHPFEDDHAVADEDFNPNARKLYVYDTIKGLEQRNIDAVILTCFISHTFIHELRSEIRVPIVNIMEGLRIYILKKYPQVRRLGIMTSSYVRKKRLFEEVFGTDYQLIYPDPQIQNECLMAAIYGPQGIKAGQLRGVSIDLIRQACQNLIERGAELIVPGLTEIPIVLDTLREQLETPIVDSNQVYAEYAVEYQGGAFAKTYKVGIIGGVGPAATVDFMDKIIRHTEARRDQDHIKMLVEHNPQIPDRTENLIGEGTDPTIPLYSACKKLERGDADLIAIPCNTAHAFVERIQRYLSIPVVNMLFETVEYIKRHYSACRTIGLLATTGTIKSRVYHDMIDRTDFHLVVPESAYQDKVMTAIYGEHGVKAGYTAGTCKQDLLQALVHLVEQGAEVIILGCTELPLLVQQTEELPVAGKRVAVLDPSDILARRCVQLSRRETALEDRYLSS